MTAFGCSTVFGVIDSSAWRLRRETDMERAIEISVWDGGDEVRAGGIVFFLELFNLAIEVLVLLPLRSSPIELLWCADAGGR